MKFLPLIVFLVHSTITAPQHGWRLWSIENGIIGPLEVFLDRDMTSKEFFDEDAYIILHVYSRGALPDGRDFYYLIGPNANTETKTETVRRVMELYTKLIKKSSNDQILINKEIYGHESEWFFNKFLKVSVQNGSRTHTPIRRMYKVTGTNEQPRFIQVPPNFDVLNRENYFILESGSEVFMYHPQKKRRDENIRSDDLVNNKFYSAAFDFGELITRIGKRNTDLKHVFPDSPYFSNDRFFELLNGASQIKHWYNIPETSHIEYTLENNSLYEYPNLLDITHTGVFQLNMLNPSGCYILEKNNVNETVLYIGEKASTHQISDILNYGEYLASNGITVSIAQKNNPLMHFVIAFDELNNVLINKSEQKKLKKLKGLLP